MTTTQKSPSQIEQTELLDLVEQLTDLMQAGDRAAIEKLLHEHPNDAPRLREFVRSLEVLAEFQLAPSSPTTSKLVASPAFVSGVLGDFRILHQIGRGGMGVVFEAEQISIPRKVALKILPLAALVDPRALQRFKNEVAAIATLQHPHIVAVYSIGEERGIHYFAMQLIRGQSLAAVIRELRARSDQDQRLSGDALNQAVSDIEKQETAQAASGTKDFRSQAVGDLEETKAETVARGRSSTVRNVGDPTYFCNVARLIQQAAEALQHAHDHGIVHRDVKPGNLLLDSSGTLFVTDFGLARIETGAGVTMTGDILGTLRYMSPEQVLANRVIVDHRTDVYSLGATLYELLTLQPMWTGEGKAELIRQISFDEPTRPQRINPAIPTDLETIVLKAISKNPIERYDSTQAFADDLRLYLEFKPIIARRPALVQRLNKWSRRNPEFMWSAIIILLVVALGLGISNYLVSKERTAKINALNNAQLSEKAATDSLNRAEEYASFVLYDMLGMTSVEGQSRFSGRDDSTLTKDTTVVALLNRAADKLRARNDLDPLIEADLHWIIGVNLRGIGEFEEAIEFLKRSQKLRTGILGADHPDAFRSSNSLAVAYDEAGRHDLAIPLYEDTLQRERAKLGAEHPATIGMMSNLGECYRKAGNLALAMPLLEDSFAQSVASLGTNHLETIISANNLALGYMDAGNFDLAGPLLERALKHYTDKFAAHDPRRLKVLSNLATNQAKSGKYELSAPLYEEALKGLTASLGADNPDTLFVMCNLGNIYRDIGKWNQAIRLLDEAYTTSKAKLGVAHPLTLSAMNSLAGTYWRTNQIEESIPLFEELRSLHITMPGSDQHSAILALMNLGTNYKDAGRLDDSVAVFEEAVDAANGQFGLMGHTMTVQMIDAYVKKGEIEKARNLVEQLQRTEPPFPPDSIAHAEYAEALGRRYYLPIKAFADAEGMLRECLAIRERGMPVSWHSYHARWLLGEALLGQEKFEEAETNLSEAYEGLLMHKSKIPPIQFQLYMPESENRVVRLFEKHHVAYPDAAFQERAGKWRQLLGEFRNSVQQQAERN